MKLSELGEFNLINRLVKMIEAPPESVIVGIGDDAAAWYTGDTITLATTDTLIEDVHFKQEYAPWRDVGWKALAVNVSDIAAMGGVPQYALVTLAVPTESALTPVEQIYKGLTDCAHDYGVAIIGGDLVRAAQVSVSVALIGRAGLDEEGEQRLMRRDGAQAGHVLAITGSLGDSAAGLRRCLSGAPADDPLVRAHLHPRPPLETAAIAVRLGVSCAIDISDGLVQDLGHICELTGLGALIRTESLPLSQPLRTGYPHDAIQLACGGGEDYQLLFAAPAETIRLLRTLSDVRVTPIGQMEEHVGQRPRVIDSSGNQVRIESTGWDQLKG
jgi:thiamine-monophosphate kinase